MSISPYQNTNNKNLPAVRRGVQVPPDAVNLAWAKSPEITPENNMIIVDTSAMVSQNVDTTLSGFYYSNELGILQDQTGNQLFQDEYPDITDQYNVAGDLTGVDLSQSYIFPFQHISRFFHIDFAGLCLGTGLTNYTGSVIKVVDKNGNQYVDSNGVPRYKIQICPAVIAPPQSTVEDQLFGNQMPYRVYAYLDTDTTQNLYLTYNKIDINALGNLVNQAINFTEIINLKPVFSYRPEAAEVVDPINREKRWYSSRDAEFDEQTSGINNSYLNGYHVFVPKKAVTDPRIFQLFRWRIACSFTQNFAVDEHTNPINVGVVITNNDPYSNYADFWQVLSGSPVNQKNLTFQNPLNANTLLSANTNEYWYVNFDNISIAQLAQFDILIWTPTTANFDFANYMAQIRYFTQTLGKTLFIDTENGLLPANLGFTTTAGTSPTTGKNMTTGDPTYAYTGGAISLSVDAADRANVPAIINANNVGLTTYTSSVLWPYLSTTSGNTFSTGTYYTPSTELNITALNTWRFQASQNQVVFNPEFHVPSNVFNATSLGGWQIAANEPISELQTTFGPTGGFTQFIASTPYGATNLILASLSNNQSVTTNLIANPTSWTVSNVTTQFASVQGPLQSGFTSGTTAHISVPSVPSNQTYVKTEVFQQVVFNGSLGSVMSSYLNGGDLDNITHNATIISGGQATIYAGDSLTDSTLPGNTLTLQVLNTINNGPPYNTVQSVASRASVFYYQANTTTNTINITPSGGSSTFTMPVFTGVPVVSVYKNLYFSTFNIFSSAINGVSGALQFMYNICLLALSNKLLHGSDDVHQYASSYAVYSPWVLSWVINTTDNPAVLTPEEKQKYDFVYRPEDVATPQLVWQRQLSKETCKHLIDAAIPPSEAVKLGNATRTYTIQATNNNVAVPVTLTDDSVPFAWTEAYSPALTVPPDLNAYVIQEREVPGDYQAGQYISRSYPPKPYAFQVDASYDAQFNLAMDYSVNWTATGTATLTWDTETWVPPQNILVPVTSTEYVSSTQEVNLTWAGNSGVRYGSNLNPFKGAQHWPWGLFLWTQANYTNWSYGSGQLNWVYNGLTGQYAEGSSGDVIRFMQEVLNDTQGAGLRIDGYYGAATAGAIRGFQTRIGARYIDGVVDAETFSLISGTAIAHGMVNAGQPWGRFYDFAYKYMQVASISDNNTGTIFGKRSWAINGPSQIWEIFSVFFPQQYNIHAINFTPYLEGWAPTMLFEAVHATVVSDPFAALINFNSENMMIKHMGRRVGDGQTTSIPFSPRNANYIMVGVGQDQTSFPSTSRFMGVRDISALATVQTTQAIPVTTMVTETVPGYYVTTVHQAQVFLSASGTTDVKNNSTQTVQAVPDPPGMGTLSNLHWTSVSTNNPAVTATISSTGLITFATNAYNIAIGTNVIQGPKIPSNSQLWYSTYANRQPVNQNFLGNTSSLVRPYPETGWVSKDEGLKLLCNTDGTPFGWPSIPTSVTPAQRQLAKYTMDSTGTDATVQIGFYDKNAQEFVTGIDGSPEISFADYIARGAANMYIAVITTYELDTSMALPTYGPTGSTLPNIDDAPMIPYLMVFPIYGVTTTPASKISIAPLPNNLGETDTWGIPIRTGKFSLNVFIPPGSTNALANDPNVGNYISQYQGSTVQAFYDVYEAKHLNWSVLFGDPNKDIVDETPLIVDDFILQVRQTPILMNTFPTVYNTPADPNVPIFSVYQRNSITSPWHLLPWSNIADYNVETGEIYLQGIAWSDDPNLFKVDYTTSNPTYLFKYSGISSPNTILLNPYQDTTKTFLNKTIYIYITPLYIIDAIDQVVTLSTYGAQHYGSTLGYTFDPTIFNPTSANYNPLAIQLGIVRVSTDIDLSDLVLIDSRQRGGGAPEGLAPYQVLDTMKEAQNYWDINYGSGMSYQNSGFIIIRLSSQLKSMYSDDFIYNVIRNNLGAGIEFKLEDLTGNDWANISV